MKKKQKYLLTIFAALLMVVLAACGKSSAKETGEAKQTLSLSTEAPMDTIDISKMTGYGSTGNAFESFYRLGKNGKVTPGLAKSGKVSDDAIIPLWLSNEIQ